MMLRITADGKSDIGKVRQSNQDAFACDTNAHLYVVADGMGGHSGGEVASHKAVEALMAALREEPTVSADTDRGNGSRDTTLVRAIEAANDHVFQMASEDRKLQGMGTTLVALRVVDSTASIGSVGDSRVYLWRGQRLRQVTRDHSLVNEYVRLGTLSAEEASTHPLKHIISRAIGVHPTVEVDHFPIPLRADDVFVLCSDGLTNMLDDNDISATLAAVGHQPSVLCAELISRANAKGGLDNITVVAVHCESV
jgi:serine/threonine protein phosphatase PrpC